MSVKKIFAVVMATTMVLGSTMTAFAADANGGTGTGTNTGHLDKDVITQVLPTDTAIADFFNFTIDPENILATADKFTDGTTAAGSDFANENLVYFKQADGTFGSTSQAAAVGAKNAIDVDVKVVASVTASVSGKTIIPMVDSADALTAATEPSLLLKLKVGDQESAITSEGATVTKTIAGQESNFVPSYQTDGSYKLVEKSGVTWANNTADIQLIGKVKGGTVDKDIVAPNITLTWTVKAHATAPTQGYAEFNSGKFWFGVSSSAGFATGKIPTSVTVAGNDVTNKIVMTSYNDSDWIVVSWTDCVAAGVTAADSYVIQYVVDGTTYEVTYVEP